MSVLLRKFNSSAMYKTEEHGKLMCREILAVDQFWQQQQQSIQTQDFQALMFTVLNKFGPN